MIENIINLFGEKIISKVKDEKKDSDEKLEKENKNDDKVENVDYELDIDKDDFVSEKEAKIFNKDFDFNVSIDNNSSKKQNILIDFIIKYLKYINSYRLLLAQFFERH